MEKVKYFNSITEALDFCMQNGVRYFHFKKSKVGVALHYYEKNVKCFICEICGCETPYEYEGADPYTCADCNPVRIEFTEKVG